MSKTGGCLFRIGYFFYTKTRLGYYYHQRDIAKSKEKLRHVGGQHSNITPFVYGDLEIVPIPMMMNNYAYLVTDRRNNKSVVIDPGHAEAVQIYLSSRNIMPEAVLVTHKHWDHSGGSKEMKQHYPDLKVYGSLLDPVPEVTHPVQEATRFEFGDLKFMSAMTPGHTTGHIVYILDGKPFGIGDCVFSGDLLFLSGCGRIFECYTDSMMYALDYMAAFPDNTLVWPGHEYARENLEFACHLDQDNAASKDKLEWVNSRRANRLCTCPSTIQEEKLYNPFLRTQEESMARILGYVNDEPFTTLEDSTRARMLEEIRERKDAFCYKL